MSHRRHQLVMLFVAKSGCFFGHFLPRFSRNVLRFAFCDRNQQSDGDGQGAAAEEKRQLEREIQVNAPEVCFPSHGEP